MGEFAYRQCTKNQIKIHGYIDNNEEKQNIDKKVYPPHVLTKTDCIIISSIYYADISEQLENMGVENYIYYEELAYIQAGIDTYYQAFKGLFDEIESSKDRYIQLYDLLADELSKRVYMEVMNYRMSLDSQYIVNAYRLSEKEGCQYFDNVVVSKLNKRYTWYDVGGFDGESTLDYIKYSGGCKKIYFFEPTGTSINIAKKRLKQYENIEFIQAAVGADRGEAYINDAGGDGNFISTCGSEVVPMIKLDDYIDSRDSYIKLDVEGYETEALQGMKNAVQRFKPLLAVSVYHIPGDMHKLVGMLLSWNPNYKIYMRHYTKSYADTVCYFLNEP